MAAHLVMQQVVTMEATQEGQVGYMAAEAARPVVAAAKEVRQAAHLALFACKVGALGEERVVTKGGKESLAALALAIRWRT